MNDTARLLRRTARRQMLAQFGARLRMGFLVAAALFAGLLLVARLLALIPDWFAPWTLWSIPALALLGAAVLIRKPSARETARLIDARAGTRELFLTATMIDSSPGEFQLIVLSQAEARAAKIEPAKIVPFVWQRGVGEMAAAVAIPLLALYFLPQLDPFKKAALREKDARQEERLAETKKVTALRAEELAQKPLAAAEIEQALAALDKTFKEIKPEQKEAALQRLAEEQKELGELWKKVSNQQLKNALDKAAQNFGEADLKKLTAIKEELVRGDLSTVKKELAAAQEALRKLAAMPDSTEKRAAQEALAQQLNELAQTMKQAISSPQVNAALARALEQLDLSKLSALSQEAMQSAMESLNVTAQELEQLARAMQDGKALEEALKNLQMAKQLAECGKLDGGECQSCKGQGDYAALFAAKMAALGEQGLAGGGGRGMGPGIGDGSTRPEDDSTKTDFTPEKSRSALTGGKLLLEWKTSEVGETGARAEVVQRTIRDVQQGVSEAIQQEQVPPGYHDAIKRYFDTLPATK